MSSIIKVYAEFCVSPGATETALEKGSLTICFWKCLKQSYKVWKEEDVLKATELFLQIKAW